MKKESVEAASKNTETLTASEWAELVAHSDTRGQFHDCLLNLEENEGFYLLSALANMTVTREPTECVFIQVRENKNPPPISIGLDHLFYEVYGFIKEHSIEPQLWTKCLNPIYLYPSDACS